MNPKKKDIIQTSNYKITTKKIQQKNKKRTFVHKKNNHLDKSVSTR